MQGDEEKVMGLDKETRMAIVRHISDTIIQPLRRQLTEDIDNLKIRGWDNRNDKVAVADIEGQLTAMRYYGLNSLELIDEKLSRILLPDL